jgi:hypothetical protein
MKKLIIVFGLIFCVNSAGFSQLPESYPFKTIADDQGNLYVTGDSLNPSNNTYDFIVKKFTGGANVWTKLISYPFGNDRGWDIAIYEEFNVWYVLAIGNIASQNDSKEILTVKLNANSGDTLWTRRYLTKLSCEGYGIAIDVNGNPYITGFCKYFENQKRTLTLKYDKFGTLQWSRIYSNKDYKIEDVGTEILVDNNYVYVLGYTYNGELNKNDIVLLNYNLNGGNQEVDIFPKRMTNETPTGFVITGEGLGNDKSRISLTSVTDNSTQQKPSSSYLTIYL